MQFVRLAKARSVPVLAVSTPDPRPTMGYVRAALESLSKELDSWNLYEWDIARGLSHTAPQTGEPVLTSEQAEQYADPATLLLKFAMDEMKLGDTLVMHGAHVLLADNPVVVQAIVNLREPFKASNRTLVLLGPSFTLPPELRNDVLLYDEPLPAREQLRKVVDETVDEGGVEAAGKERERLTDAVQGLTHFAAEQILSLGLRHNDGKPAVDLDFVWERKKVFIGQTPGLSINRSGVKFEDVRGLEYVKQELQGLIDGPAPPRVVVFIDEIEKGLAGSGTDTSGTTQDQLGTLLTYMDAHQTVGALFLGVPGGGKSYLAQAAGNSAGVPTINFDFGGFKGSLVGQSEQNIRQGLKIVTAIAPDSALFLATCNNLQNIPDPLRRRFTMGIYYFDLAGTGERESAWDLWLKRYGHAPDAHRDVKDEGWTFAEIRNCCDLAWRLNIPVQTAARRLIPYSVSGAAQLAELRGFADGKFRSANTGELFRVHKPQAPTGRKQLKV